MPKSNSQFKKLTYDNLREIKLRNLSNADVLMLLNEIDRLQKQIEVLTDRGNTLKELLEKWSQLEAEVCQESGYDPGWFSIGRDNFFQLVSGNGAFEDSSHLSEIQGAVQQAIEAKDWHYEQRWWGGKDKVAYVYPTGITKLIRHDCGTHAEALLRAYLEALELTGGAKDGE